MSQSPMASVVVRDTAESSGTVRTLVSEQTAQDLLNALDDADCRAILDATSDEVLSATELSERFDIPRSTTYRKLHLLTDTGLLEERTRIRRSGKHVSEYTRRAEAVIVTLATPTEVGLRVRDLTDRGESAALQFD